MPSARRPASSRTRSSTRSARRSPAGAIQDYPHITPTTRDLLAHWRAEDRERRLFFCQIEAAETAIYLTEAAERMGDTKAAQRHPRRRTPATTAAYRGSPSRWRPGPARPSSWRCSSPGRRSTSWPTRKTSGSATRSSSSRPGITIRDRLRVLLPERPGQLLPALTSSPPEQLDRLQAATIVITNFHAFLRREKIEAAGADKKVLAGGDDAERFTETPAEMVRRSAASSARRKNIVVLNDEAHHCYAPAPIEDARRRPRRRRADRGQEATTRRRASGCPASRPSRDKLGVRAVYDLRPRRSS